MHFSKTAVHAILILFYMAQQRAGRVIPARDVADFLGISTQATMKILKALATGGLVLSRPGRHGGFELAVPAEEITLLRVVEAIDGPLGSKDRSQNVLPKEVAEAVQDVASEANQLLRRFLASKTVPHLAPGHNGAEPGV